MVLKLDPEQQEVVNYDGSSLVVAGPGSGKTRTLVAKAESLYSKNADLICLTFTRAAAREMKSRMPGLPVSTIHSYCYSLVGWDKDYDDLLLRAFYKKDKYDWVLIDEAQDLTPLQMSVVLGLLKPNSKLFMVGDPYQSIYGFQGAVGEDIIGIADAYKLKRFDLHNNYRSCSDIVRMLNRVYPRDLVSAGVKKLGTTAVLARTNDLVRWASSQLEEKGVGHTVRVSVRNPGDEKETYKGSDTVKVMTCHCSKGLEFDRVVLYAWEPNMRDRQEKNLYFVVLSRASQEFYRVASPEGLFSYVK
jgi:superfamily I DNA/RNA helicase